MTEGQMCDLVKECGLDWRSGYMPMFVGDPTNRYAVLITAVAAAERAAIIALMPGGYSVDPQWVCDTIRARGET